MAGGDTCRRKQGPPPVSRTGHSGHRSPRPATRGLGNLASLSQTFPFYSIPWGFPSFHMDPPLTATPYFASLPPFMCTNEWHQALSHRRATLSTSPHRMLAASQAELHLDRHRSPGPPTTTVLLSVSANLTTNTEHLSKQFFPIHRALHNHLA